MGQYWIPVNIDKKEFIDPHRLGTGLKLWEQIANHPGTGAALLILLANMPDPRGGGDFDTGYPAAEEAIGRWAGDRVILVGDYAEPGDLPGVDTEHIYEECGEGGEYTDISEIVCAVIEYELEGKYTGIGWRHFERGSNGNP